MTTFNFSIGDLLRNELTIAAIRGRWVDLSDGTTVSRAQVVEIGAHALWERNGAKIDFAPYRDQYVKTRLEDGRRRVDSGDAVAVALRGADIEQVYTTVAAAIGVPAPELRARYSHLNIGQQRMNLGNRLRAHNKRVENGEV
jgi:hypothetical protein